MVKKIFVLRTNSLVSKENCGTLFSFGNDNQIVIPIEIIDELEDLTHQYNQKSKNAKAILDYLSSWDIKKLLSENGVKQKNGSSLRLENSYIDVNISLSNLNRIDKRCLQICKGLYDKYDQHVPVILVSKNTALRIKSNSIGIMAQNFKDDIYPTLCEQYTGRQNCTASKSAINKLYSDGMIKLEQISEYKNIDWYPNMFLNIQAFDSKPDSTLARYTEGVIVPLEFSNSTPFNIFPKNAGQTMLMEALLQDCDKAPLVIAKGGAGTGKTILALACALSRIEDGIYKKILYSRPTDTVGQENVGFLPGGIGDKYIPHMGAILDNLNTLIDGNNEGKSKKTAKYYFDKYIEIQPIGFLRGRTIVNSYYIIDEVQNVDPSDIKSILTRSGKNTKIIFIGDATQIDNPDLNERFNGLVYLSEQVKDWNNAWQVTLTDDESVRSDVAKMAAICL